MLDTFRTLQAFGATLYHTRRGLSRDRFLNWQTRKLRGWLHHELPQVGFYPHAVAQLTDLPIIDKQTIMSDFAGFNRDGITAADGWRAYEGAGQIGDVSIGASTGTSGNRTLYAITRAERARWLGVILAKTLPGILREPERVAVILPQMSSLYDQAGQSRRITLQFFDLRQGPEAWSAQLLAFGPTTLVAPPRVLRHLCETLPDLRPRRVFAGGETLDPVDRTAIEAGFGIPLGQIYMASEGLLGVTCSHGIIHLAEDANVFEFEPVGAGLHSPLITGFQRRFQIMARYRMNDLLRLSEQSCPCGSPLQSVTEIVGRQDDVFTFVNGADPVLITPDVLRNAVLNAARDITDFRIIRHHKNQVELLLSPDLPNGSALAAKSALQQQFDHHHIAITVGLKRADMALNCDQKLRRVENRYFPEGPNAIF